MFCPHCGKEYSAQANFCCDRGAALGTPVSSTARKLRRSRTDKRIAGVCGGFASYFGIDATLIRIIWLMLVIFAGCGILAYLIAWIIMPQEPLPQAASVTTAPAIQQTAESH